MRLPITTRATRTKRTHTEELDLSADILASDKVSMEYILHSNSFIRVSASLVKVFAKIRVHLRTRLVKQCETKAGKNRLF